MKFWLMIASVVLLTGCGISPAPAVPTALPTASVSPPLATPSPGATVQSPAPSATPTSAGNVAAQRAIRDLAARLSIDAASIQVDQVQADEFPAQGLGCSPETPAKTEGDQPAFVTGLSIQLRVGETHYEYRSHGQELVFCGTFDR